MLRSSHSRDTSWSSGRDCIHFGTGYFHLLHCGVSLLRACRLSRRTSWLCTASRLFLKMHKCKSCAKMHGANWKSYYEVEVLLAVHQRRASPSWVVTKDADFQLGIQEWSVLQLGIINSLRSWMVPLKETRAARQAIAHLALETTPGCTKDSPRCQV